MRFARIPAHRISGEIHDVLMDARVMSLWTVRHGPQMARNCLPEVVTVEAQPSARLLNSPQHGETVMNHTKCKN